jgi:hypothetical protein
MLIGSFRKLLILAAALAVSACSYGSAVDIAPMNARISKPVIAPGDYCEVKGQAAPFTIVSHEDCVPITWNAPTRTYTMKDPDKQDEDMTAPVVSLGSSLYAAQITTPEAKGDRYQLFVFIAKGNAFAMLSALDDEPLKKLAARHRKLTFTPGSDGRLYIASGKPEHIRAFLKDAAKESLRKTEGDDGDISVGMLDTAGAADHPATKQQTKDIEDVLKLAKSMTPR